MKEIKHGLFIRNRCEKASLTVEAALIMPIFLYLIIAFLYLIQIFTLQEHIQSAITKMGLGLSKTAYVYKDFSGIGDALDFDDTIFGTEYDLGLHELAETAAQGAIVRAYAGKFLDKDRINHSFIKDGYGGISFYGSKVLDEEDCIDITVRYRVNIPVKIFVLDDMRMFQRVRVRAWTGREVTALYKVVEDNDNTEGTTVFITESGSVYHTNKDCSHIKLSVRSVLGIPSGLKNDNGSRYGPCEICCDAVMDELAVYYITSDGVKFHSSNKCSGIKRNVKEVKLSEVGNRPHCKRCSNK